MMTSPLMHHMMISTWTVKPSSSVYTWVDMQAVQVWLNKPRFTKSSPSDKKALGCHTVQTQNWDKWIVYYMFLCMFLHRWCISRLWAGAEPGHGSVQHLRCRQWRLQSLLLHLQPQGGELQHSVQPHGMVVQPVRPGKPQRLPWRPRAELWTEDTHPVGHLETEWGPSHHQICHDEDQEDCNQ